jgi:hypothetical protein
MAEASQEFHSDGVISPDLKSAVAHNNANIADGNEWRNQIPEEVRSEKFWENYKTPADAYKAHAELVKYRGANPRIPGPDAKPEEIAAFNKRMGVPDKPEEYKLNLAKDADSTFVNEFLSKVAHPNGFTPKQAQVIADYWTNDVLPKLTAGIEPSLTPEQHEANQKEHWGADYQKNMDSFDRFVRKFVKDDETAAAFDSLPKAARMKVFDAIAEAGAGLREGSAIDTVKDGNAGGQTKGQLESRKAEIFSDKRYTDHQKAIRQPLVDEMNQINQKLRALQG